MAALAIERVLDRAFEPKEPKERREREVRTGRKDPNPKKQRELD